MISLFRRLFGKKEAIKTQVWHTVHLLSNGQISELLKGEAIQIDKLHSIKMMSSEKPFIYETYGLMKELSND